MFESRKELKKEIERLTKELSVADSTISNLSKHNIELQKDVQGVSRIADKATLEAETNLNNLKNTLEEVEPLREYKKKTVHGLAILQKFVGATLLPKEVDSSIDFTHGAVVIKLKPTRYNKVAFPAMELSIYNSDYCIETNVSFPLIANNVLNDIFQNVLSNNVKLKNFSTWQDRYTIYGKDYQFSETNKFIEDIIGCYEQAYTIYKKIITPVTVA